MEFYINGQRVNGPQAHQYLESVAERRGYEAESWEGAWKRLRYSEDAREFINEISDYSLEVVVN